MLRPGGALLIGDFLPHDQEWRRDALADQWLGLSPDELTGWLDDAGFEDVEIRRVTAEQPGALNVFVAKATRPNP